MEMITIPISVPKDLLLYFDIKENGLAFEQTAMLLYPLIQRCVISHGRAAEILGVRKWNLIEFYDKLGIPYLNQSCEELDTEIAGFAALREKRAV